MHHLMLINDLVTTFISIKWCIVVGNILDKKLNVLDRLARGESCPSVSRLADDSCVSRKNST